MWAAYGLPIEYPEIGVFRITDDSIYLFRTKASPEGVPGQRPHLWAFVAPSSSSMGVWVSVVLFHGGLCFRSPMAEKNPNNALSPRVHSDATDAESASKRILFFMRSNVLSKRCSIGDLRCMIAACAPPWTFFLVTLADDALICSL